MPTRVKAAISPLLSLLNDRMNALDAPTGGRAYGKARGMPVKTLPTARTGAIQQGSGAKSFSPLRAI